MWPGASPWVGLKTTPSPHTTMSLFGMSRRAEVAHLSLSSCQNWTTAQKDLKQRHQVSVFPLSKEQVHSSSYWDKLMKWVMFGNWRGMYSDLGFGGRLISGFERNAFALLFVLTDHEHLLPLFKTYCMCAVWWLQFSKDIVARVLAFKTILKCANVLLLCETRFPSHGRLIYTL